MKHKVLILITVLIIIFVCGFQVSGEKSPTELPTPDFDRVLAARFENMLDHNQVYNDDFDSVTDMVNNSLLTLLDKCDEDGYIKEDIVSGFIYNMYGIDLSEYEESSDFEQKQGYLFVIPKGYTSFDHTITAIEDDGDYINVDSVVIIENHDSAPLEYNCRSMFVKNEQSTFGHNLVFCTYYQN